MDEQFSIIQNLREPELSRQQQNLDSTTILGRAEKNNRNSDIIRTCIQALQSRKFASELVNGKTAPQTKTAQKTLPNQTAKRSQLEPKFGNAAGSVQMHPPALHSWLIWGGKNRRSVLGALQTSSYVTGKMHLHQTRHRGRMHQKPAHWLLSSPASSP